MTPDPTRRGGFLLGPLLSLLLAAGAGACGPDVPPERGQDPAGVRVERAWPLMGTFFRVGAWAADTATARRGIRAARGAAARVDSLMSTYREDSEVSRINRRAGSGTWTDVSRETLEVVETSLRWARASDGAFDPTVGPLMVAWGFRGGEPRRPPEAVLDSVRRLVDHRAVEVDREAARVRLRDPGMALDFGAVAKGYALDLALDALRGEGARAGMVDLGGNVSVFGPPPREEGGWVLGVRHPRRDGRLLGTVRTDGGSVSTSGDYEQVFEVDGVRYSHVMDPRTGRPARGLAAVTVSVDDGATADVLSTLLFVLGPREGRGFVERHGPGDGVTALWVRDPGPGSLHRGLVETLDDPEDPRIEVSLPPADPGG